MKDWRIKILLFITVDNNANDSIIEWLKQNPTRKEDIVHGNKISKFDALLIS